MFDTIKFNTKLYGGILSILLISMAIFLTTALIQLKSGLVDLGRNSLENTSLSVFNSLKMQNDLIQEKLESDLKIMDQEFANYGAFHLDSAAPRQQEMVNQVTKEKAEGTIPSLMLGDTVLNDNFELVDRVQKLNGGTATVFQVVDDKLLRISTNVLKTDGQRAVGTYIPSSSPVYQTVMQGETFRGKAFVVSDWYLTAYKPLKDPAGKIVAVIYVGRQILSPQLLTFLTSTKAGEDGYFFVYNSEGHLLVHPKYQGENIFEKKEYGDQFKEHKEGFLSYEIDGTAKTVYTRYYDSWDWYLVAGMDDEKMVHGLDSKIRNSNLLIGAFILLAGALVALFLTRSMGRALKELAAKSMLVAEGDYSQTFHYPARDAIGSLTDSLNAMVARTRAVLAEISNASSELSAASSDMEKRAEDLVNGSRENGMLAEQTAHSSDEVRSSMHSVSAAMEQASTNINSVAIAANEMSNTIREIAENSERAKETTTQAVQRAGESSKRVDQLGQAAREISAVTETITEISAQTNLLALNATIEAARAGEAGKGFAVVANEIKELAKQTASATEDIRSKITGIQSATSLTVSEIAEISAIIEEMNEIVATIATAVEEQSVTTREIAENVSQASLGVEEINENVAMSSSMTEQINQNVNAVKVTSHTVTENSASIAGRAKTLTELAGKLDALVSTFRM